MEHQFRYDTVRYDPIRSIRQDEKPLRYSGLQELPFRIDRYGAPLERGDFSPLYGSYRIVYSLGDTHPIRRHRFDGFRPWFGRDGTRLRQSPDSKSNLPGTSAIGSSSAGRLGRRGKRIDASVGFLSSKLAGGRHPIGRSPHRSRRGLARRLRSVGTDQN
jgi:hypothetical protein